jgi:hypothetical protein
MSTQNTLTGLIPIIQTALDKVGQEQIGFIGAVAMDASAEGAAKDETIRVPIVPAAGTSASWSPAQTAPDTGNITVGYVDITIDTAVTQPVRWNGEEEKGLRNAGMYEKIMQDRFAQAFRKMRNEMEAKIALAAISGASRATGTAGVTPFGSSIGAVADIMKILKDNGCTTEDIYLILDSSAVVNLGNLVHLTQVNTAGTDQLLRDGIISRLLGVNIKESSQIVSHTKGAGTGYDVDGTEAAGQTTLTLEGGTVNTTGLTAGDIITFAGGTNAADTNKYVINSGTVATAGDIVLGNPGLIIAKDTNDELTVGASYRGNVAFQKQAIQFVQRPIAFPSSGDAARDRTIVTDPVSGLSFSVSMYGEYGQMHYSIGCCYGVKVIKSEHVAILLG